MRNIRLTDEQKQLVAERYGELRAKGYSAGDIEAMMSQEMNISPRTVRQYRPDAYRVPETSGDYEVKPNPSVRGTSTLYDAQGKVKLQWVKEDRKLNEEQLRQWLAELASDVPRAKESRPPKAVADDLLTILPMGDPHLGMYAWGEETGEDFDLDIATRDLCHAVDRLVRTTPPSKECLIANLGDFFHADTNAGVTLRSNHKLDTDTRWAKVLGAGLKAMRQCIQTALEHHEKVTVINAIGNHDDHSSVFLSIALSNIYENEPRITIIDRPTITHYYRFGENLIGVHHGHTIKPDKLPLLMATERPQDWAECKHRIWLCGHLHQDIQREYNGVRVETFRTLAARDAWAASMGYQSGRDMKGLVHHRRHGAVARHIVSVDMLRAAA